MKKYRACIILIMILIIANNANALFISDTVPKISNNQSDTYMQLMKKYNNERTVSTIMVIGGGSMALAGSILALSSLNHLFEPGYSHPNYGSAVEILGVGGVIILLAAIPIKLMANKNKKKAQLFINNESLLITPQVSRLTSVGIKITL